MADSSRAVFVSYASQDAAAAQRICEALRAAGIEVWFDQSELRGGDAWDQKIRRELHDCTLFIPIVSANTAARHEGYFRLEWDLADQRTHMIARNRAFIVPVCVDTTAETGADTPESFQRVQWTRLPGGETPPAFVERVQRLLSGATDSAADPPRPGTSTVASDRPGRRRARVLYAAIAVAAALALGYFALERLHRPAANLISTASIAVLPLANESGDAGQRYFSDGISEDLITALGQFPGLKVIGRSSAFKFRDSKEDSRSIGTLLGVSHLVEGTVRRSGDMVRVSAELIDTADGTMQWSQRYDRPYKDLFALQDEITHAVVAALRVKLLPGEHAAEQTERPPSGSLEAYNAFLQARFYGARGTEADVRRAIESLTQAIELDPQYALAWGGLSVGWESLGGQFLEGASQQEAFSKARAAADRALALGPDLAYAHGAKANVLKLLDFDWRGAEAEYAQALALAPNDTRAKAGLADLRATLGDVDSAIKLMREVIPYEPLQSNLQGLLSGYLWAANRLDEAEQACRKAIELAPTAPGNYWQLAAIEIQRGHAEAAVAAARQEPPGPIQDAALAMAMQIGSDRKAADAALKTLIDKDAEGAPFQIAEVYALRNDAKSTFEWLDRAWSTRDPGITQLLWDSFILRFKSDPRFAAFCRTARLPVPGETSAIKST
ncbi:MAG TPA: TIR domain-containing protein [Steroidobacteraceae bacterium]|nr:TIR domain-containing protein [Steroidobacteraceae bacterium]